MDREDVDLSDSSETRRMVQELRPRLIVNAAAYTAVDQAETDQHAAQALNAEAPAVLAEAAKKVGAALVHFSTDYVFDGLKNSPYIEDDPTNPLSVYGKTKLAGEEAIRQIGVPHLIFRTAWVYGTRGRNFLLTILRLGFATRGTQNCWRSDRRPNLVPGNCPGNRIDSSKSFARFPFRLVPFRPQRYLQRNGCRKHHLVRICPRYSR